MSAWVGILSAKSPAELLTLLHMCYKWKAIGSLQTTEKKKWLCW